MVLVLTSCVEDGTLRVKNNTSAMIWFDVDSGVTNYLNAYSSWNRNYSSDRWVDIEYSGDHVFSSSAEVLVENGRTTSLEISATGGAISLLNNSGITIYSVYLSPSSSSSWGSDQLTGVLNPNQTTLWTVSAGSWDIRIKDIAGNNYYIYDRYINLDHTLSVSFTYSQKTEQKVKHEGIDPNLSDACRIEKKN
jgi:hypothetical protein